MLSKSQILAASDGKIELCPVPEWGGDVYLRSLKGWERDQFDEDQQKQKSVVHFRAKLVARSMCDGSGNSLGFTDAEILLLSEKNAAVLDRIFDKCCVLSRIGNRVDEEQIIKNSNGQSEHSG